LRHIGDHLLKRRLDLGLHQKQAAMRLGVDAESLRNWEAGRTSPGLRFYPTLIKFLTYNPLPEARTRGEFLERERISRGWSRKHAAKRLGMDEATVRRIEDDVPRLRRRSVQALCGLVDENGARS